MQINLTHSEYIALLYVSQELTERLAQQPSNKDSILISKLRINAVIKKYAEEEKRCRDKRIMKFQSRIKNI